MNAPAATAPGSGRALAWAVKQDRPTLIACKTVIGKGAPNMGGTHKVHGAALGKDEVAATRVALDWPYEPFTVPDDVARAWRSAGRKGAKARKAWEARLAASPLKAEFARAMAGDLPAHAATRVHSGSVLEQVFGQIPDLVGGSADLTGSNNTYVKNTKVFDAPDYDGRYVNYGVREFGMAAAMNGMALHGGVIPYGGTFLVFSDYARPALRLSALMGVRTIFVGTHDSIGLGEDGPTHQPVEHLASLRAMPNLNVFRPADAIETAECWKLALAAKTTPSVLALSRQKTAAVRDDAGENRCARGAYQLAAATRPAQVTIFASGTEVPIALAARDALEADGVGTRVVSVPSFELFEAQPADYQAAVIGETDVRIAVEAGVRLGWDRFIGSDGAFIGMHGFGASAPDKALYAHFGITAEAVVAAAKARL